MTRSHGVAVAAGVLMMMAMSRSAGAQLSGHNFRGDFGLQAGSQPAPRFYFAPFYANYSTSTIRNRDGDKLNTSGSISVNVVSPLAWYVTNLKMLGANYSVMAALPLSSNALEAPLLDSLKITTKFDVGDLYVQPINLGWHFARADVMAGAGVYVPTGKFSAGADDNTGLGMWSYELFGGATVFADRDRTWSIAALASFETHSKKKDTDVKVGDILTVEGGLGKSFFEGAGMVGVAYFAQWKLSDDDLGALPNPFGKARTYGIGPELQLPVPIRQKLVALLRARYLWDVGSRTTYEGNTFVAIVTVPIPGIAIE